MYNDATKTVFVSHGMWLSNKPCVHMGNTEFLVVMLAIWRTTDCHKQVKLEGNRTFTQYFLRHFDTCQEVFVNSVGMYHEQTLIAC